MEGTKNYDLKKEYAQLILKNITKCKVDYNKAFYSYISLKELDKNEVYLNDIYEIEDSKLIDILYEINNYYEILQKISNDQINEEIFKKYEDNFLIIKESIHRINKKYKTYYYLLHPRGKYTRKIDIINSNTYKIMAEQDGYNNELLISFHKKKLYEAYNENYSIEINHNYGGEYTTYQNTFEGFKETFDKCSEQLSDELIKFLKL